MTIKDLIVVGGSAGAIEALEVLLPAVRPDHPPVVVVLHVGAHKSGLAQLLGPRCAVPVREANDKDELRRGEILFAPGGYHLLVGPDRLVSLSCDPPIKYARPSIDALFESAAWAYAPRVLGILLSGANDDGAAGCAAIAKAGGTVWAQSGAIFSIMPDAAAALVTPAVFAPVDELARRLGSISASRRGP